MPLRELPDRPNLEQLKKQAKSLLACRAGARSRRARPLRRPARVAEQVDRRDAAAGLALHDAQSVIAREHGFPSWNALREEVEARTLSFDAAVEEFIRCATGGGSGRAQRLLALHPRHRDRIAAHGARARRRRGRRGAAARSSCARDAAGRAAELGAAALRVPHVHARGRPGARRGPRRDRAAPVRAGRESERRVSLELASRASAHGAVGRGLRVSHLPLAEVLLEAGANPTDGVSAHIAGGGGNLAALELLHRYGVNVNGIPGGVPPLVYMMLWADKAGRPALAAGARRGRESRLGR